MVTNIKHISTDIESWGTRSGFDIRSIGACLFNPFDKSHTDLIPDNRPNETSEYFYAACSNPLVGTYDNDHYTDQELDMIDGAHRKYNLKRDPKTVSWWNESAQREASKDAFSNPIDLKDALIGLSFFILELSEDVRNGQAYDVCLWTHGSAFDPGLLEAAYHACSLTVPWFYRAPRDTRTIFDEAGIVNHTAHLKKHRYGVLHNALHDAISQARAITASKQIILGWKEKAELVSKLNTELTDKKYMLQALYELLGPKAKEMADIWDKSGVLRVHHSWGPDAINLTGEQRAEVLLAWESAPRNEITNVDKHINTDDFLNRLTEG